MRYKSICIFIILSFIFGCAHNEHIAAIEKAKWEAYAQATTAYYNNLNDNNNELVDLQIDEEGKIKGLKVYNSDKKLPPMPREPIETKTWGAQMMDSSSEVLITGLKWGAGIFAIKVITDNAGDDIRDSYNSNSKNNSSGPQNIGSGQISGDVYKETNNSDSSQHLVDSGNSQNTETTTTTNTNEEYEYADSYNTDNSINDSYDEEIDNSINDSYDQDNRENYSNDSRENYSNDSRENYENDNGVTNNSGL